MHDETLDRTTNGSGPVGKTQFAQLRRLDAALHHRLKYAPYQTRFSQSEFAIRGLDKETKGIMSVK